MQRGVGYSRAVNLPNAITAARIALVPVFVFLAYEDDRDTALAAFLVFIVASLSDFVDGYLARRYKVVSKVGEFLDPLADKLLVGAALVVLVATRDFPLWAAVAIAFREVAVQLLRIRIVSMGARLPASPVAKLKTVAQIWMVGWWLLPWSHINVGHWMWLGATLVTTAWSGAQYFARAEKEKRKRQAIP